MTRNSYTAIGAGITLSILLLWGTSHQTSPGKERAQPVLAVDTTGNNAADIARWEKEIETRGAAPAYAEILKETATFSDSKQHLAGHIFGRALYAEKGVDGFTVCDPADLFGGCSHEFLAEAVQDRGIPVITVLNSTCIARYGPRRAITCQHGIGHGLLNFYGYDEKALEQSLAVCDTIQTIDQTKGCYGGSFMEFNLRTITGNTLRVFSPDDPFTLCEEVPDSYRSACYFWTPQWIFESVYGTIRTTKTFTGVGSYCTRLTDADMRASCFKGMGYFAPPSANFDKATAKQLCHAASVIQKDKDDCWSEAQEELPSDNSYTKPGK